MTARGEGGKCRSNEPMGRTGRRELGNKQKKKRKKRQDRASFHFEFVFYRVSFSSSLFKRRRRFAFRVPFSFPSTVYFLFFPRSHGSKNSSNSHGFFGGGGEGRGDSSNSFSFFSLLLRPALTPLPQKRRIPFLLDRKQPPIGSESARVAKEEEEGKKEVSGASSSPFYFFPSLQPCMFYVLQ